MAPPATRYLTVKGETLSITDWAEIRKIPLTTLLYRLDHGWSDEKAVMTPLRGYKKLSGKWKRWNRKRKSA